MGSHTSVILICTRSRCYVSPVRRNKSAHLKATTNIAQQIRINEMKESSVQQTSTIESKSEYRATNYKKKVNGNLVQRIRMNRNEKIGATNEHKWKQQQTSGNEAQKKTTTTLHNKSKCIEIAEGSAQQNIVQRSAGSK